MLSFLEHNDSQIQENVFSEINMEDLKHDDRIETLIGFMGGVYLKKIS